MDDLWLKSGYCDTDWVDHHQIMARDSLLLGWQTSGRYDRPFVAHEIRLFNDTR